MGELQGRVPNQQRIGKVFTGLGFGILDIDWDQQPVAITAEIRNRSNQLMNTYRIELSD